jgi:activator of 2-hydroxyglutaryl-CoA dehydratase
MTAKYAKKRAQPQIADFVVSQTSKLTNLTCEKLITHFSSLNRDWDAQLQSLLIDEVKDAVNSVVALRHFIAHGQAADITFERISRYYTQVKRVVEECEKMTD